MRGAASSAELGRAGRLRGSRGGCPRAGSILLGERAGGRVGREGRRPGRARRPGAAALSPASRRRWRRLLGAGGGGCAQLGRPGTCEPRNERPGAPPARSAPTVCSHLAAGAPRTCPEGGMGTLEVCTVVQSLVPGGGWGRGRVCENKELPNTHRSFFWRKVLQQGCLV